MSINIYFNYGEEVQLKILFAFAHPDDESFITGGLIHRLSKNQNVQTILYSATKGDAGKCGNPAVCKKEELAAVRENELEQAAQFLQVDHLIIDDFKDKFVGENRIQVREKLLSIIREYKPEIIITFPKHGISGHTDHIAMHEITTDIVKKEPLPFIQRLYYATFVRQERQERSFLDSEGEVDWIFHLDADDVEACRKALLAHRTQHLSVERVLHLTKDSKNFQKFANKEYFMFAITKDETVRLENYI